MSSASALATSALVLLLLFTAVWMLARRIDNYSVVDVAWSSAFAPVVVFYATCFEGWGPRRWLVAGLMTAWSLRLGLYLWRRVASHHPAEDVRYAVLRNSWKANLHSKFLKFFLLQALLVWLLTLPVWVVAKNATPHFQIVEYVGMLLWLVALGGEALSDRQLRRFKARRPDPGEVCTDGLWAYSRHPNYFFQSLLWWALFLVALPAPFGWVSILAPLAMLWFLLRVTGIPLTEKLALERKGTAYREYQKTTSPFIPWRRHKPTLPHPHSAKRFS